MGKLDSDDYNKIADALGDQIGALLKRAKEGTCVPPLEVLVTGGDDELVAQFEITPDGRLGQLIGDHLLNAKFPITATVTDRDGATWEAKFSEEDLVGGIQ